MRRLHTGRTNGRAGSRWAVIPAGWAVMHQPVAEGTMTASVALTKSTATQTWDNATQQNVATAPAAYYVGPCRVQNLAGRSGAQLVTADDPEPLGHYLVTVPADVVADEGDLVTVSGSGDALLDANVLVVGHVEVGSLRFERDLFCTLTPQHVQEAP